MATFTNFAVEKMETKGNSSGEKYSKKKFLIAFCVFIGVSALISHLFLESPIEKKMAAREPVQQVVQTVEDDAEPVAENVTKADTDTAEEIDSTASDPSATLEELAEDSAAALEFDIEQKTDIKGVLSFANDFPDLNDIQIIAAKKNGVRPLRSRNSLKPYVDAHKLVYIGASPYFVVDSLSHSIPYLTPKTYQLVNTIALNFIDSLISKGQQPHLLMVTSVLRTQDDVSKLRKGNRNSVENSAHCYGTTVDITYNRFIPIVSDKSKPIIVDRYDFKKKQVLSEVLRDLRLEGRCYVKYERRQACFHLTLRN